MKKVELSYREKQVLDILIRTGGTDKETALRLKLAEATIKVYMRSVCRKTKLHNRTQLALWHAGVMELPE